MNKTRLRRKLMGYWVAVLRTLGDSYVRLLLYPSFWHYLFHSQKPHDSRNYYSAVPNRGAGIGHQISNWISGLWFSKVLNLNYAHTNFSKPDWEYFLGYGESVVSVKELQARGYKKVRLPIFDEHKPNEVLLTQRIIDSYSGHVVFVAEQDQLYNDQYGVADEMRNLFYSASSRKNDVDIYDHSHYNIAVHARRGDIVIGQTNNNPNLLMRWSTNEYFVNVLRNALRQVVRTDKPIHIYLFSQGKESDFTEFQEFKNMHYCLDLDAQKTFLAFINADLLITSKSSFSYKPALISNNQKICPKNFWHGYPNNTQWILAEEDGRLIGIY